MGATEGLDGGFYDHIFVSRLYHLNKTLDELSDLNDNQADVALEIKIHQHRCYLEAGAKANSPQTKYFWRGLILWAFGFEENDEESLFWIESADDSVADALSYWAK